MKIIKTRLMPKGRTNTIKELKEEIRFLEERNEQMEVNKDKFKKLYEEQININSETILYLLKARKNMPTVIYENLLFLLNGKEHKWKKIFIKKFEII